MYSDTLYELFNTRNVTMDAEICSNRTLLYVDNEVYYLPNRNFTIFYDDFNSLYIKYLVSLAQLRNLWHGKSRSVVWC